MEKLRRKHPLKNYDFCYGMGVNWCDMGTGKIYYIQTYREAVDKGENPKGISVANMAEPDKIIEVVDPYIVQERMKDPEPDPRY